MKDSDYKMVIKKYNGIKGVETDSQKEFSKLQDETSNQLHDSSLEDKVVWMQMLEKIILQEYSLALVEKIKIYLQLNDTLPKETFNRFVDEVSREVKDIEYKTLKEEVDKEMRKTKE